MKGTFSIGQKQQHKLPPKLTNHKAIAIFLIGMGYIYIYHLQEGRRIRDHNPSNEIKIFSNFHTNCLNLQNKGTNQIVLLYLIAFIEIKKRKEKKIST